MANPFPPSIGSNSVVTKNLATTVVALRNRPLSNNNPLAGQALVFDGSVWIPTTPPVIPVVPPNADKVPIAFFFPGKPAASFGIVAPIVISLQLPANFTAAAWYVRTPPAADATFNVSVGAAPIGTIVVHPTGAPTWTCSARVLNPQEALIVTAPATQDAAMTDIAFTILTARA